MCIMFSVPIILSFSIVAVIIFCTVYVLQSFIKFADKELERKSQERHNIITKVKEVRFNNFEHHKKDIIIDVECEIIEESGVLQRYLPIKK
jgi:hypothetical protein